MNREEFYKVRDFYPKIKGFEITAKEFTKNLEDRTLLYGYTTERYSWHVYMIAQKVYRLIASTNEVVDYEDNSLCSFKAWDELVPNKRLYPDSCDYDFCIFLKEKGVSLPFTTYTDNKPYAKFYGPLSIYDSYKT